MNKKEYIFKKTHLPKEGWLQGCFRCWDITGQYSLYKKDYILNIIYYVYLCPKCYDKINNDPDKKYKYELAYDRYIKIKIKNKDRYK
jgi:hypothetical protein